MSSSTLIVDCEKIPTIFEGWSIPEKLQLQNRVRGLLIWNPENADLFLPQEQRSGGSIGDDLYWELVTSCVFPSNLLFEFLKRENWRFIPKKWKEKKIFFWGTIYLDDKGEPCVLCLSWNGGGWDWLPYYFHYEWQIDSPALVYSNKKTVSLVLRSGFSF